MWPFRLLAMLMGAEWLLIFRLWVSLKFLLLFIAFSMFRSRLLDIIPHWDNYYTVIPLATVAMLYHLRCAWNRSSARHREIYNTPESGVPWLVIVAQTPKLAQALEFGIIGAYLFYMKEYGTMVYPREFGALPPGWQAWLAHPANAEMFSFAYAGTAMFGLSLWNLIHSGVPLWKPKPALSAKAFQYVREERRTPPRLPTVKELADELRQVSG